MIHGGEVDSVRSHHSTSNTNHQTSPTLSQKTPGFAIQELLGLTSNNTSEHDSMNSSIKQLQHGDQQTNPFSYYNSKETLVTICQPKSTFLHERNLKWNLNFTIKFLRRQICITFHQHQFLFYCPNSSFNLNLCFSLSRTYCNQMLRLAPCFLLHQYLLDHPQLCQCQISSPCPPQHRQQPAECISTLNSSLSLVNSMGSLGWWGQPGTTTQTTPCSTAWTCCTWTLSRDRSIAVQVTTAQSNLQSSIHENMSFVICRPRAFLDEILGVKLSCEDCSQHLKIRYFRIWKNWIVMLVVAVNEFQLCCDLQTS